MRTSMAARHGFVCPLCQQRLSRDRSGKGFARHLARPDRRLILTSPQLDTDGKAFLKGRDDVL